ncbi:MAG: ribonuclease J [Alphaproteobacteria bacterium]|nr:ribonuclease J [Alphaproteobacteria bacterium]MDP6832020.1 ribonuclease J [Alphaproteobacteria bacterium]MDP6874954.1 ribonuclease J [Alphaproteobacteria bacterium]
MNMNLYGIAGQWLLVDLGVTFANGEQPGIELITPDPTYIADRRDDLAGLILTHAHEDHLGAVAHLWPRLRCPVWATPFAAALLRNKLEEAGLLLEVPLHIIQPGEQLQIGPFGIDFIALTHSTLEMNALAIRTKAGLVLHTGDWKLDPDPLLGPKSDEDALRRLGDEGVMAMIGDSTNALNDGTSGSEADVLDSLMRICADRTGRIAVASFASNVARIDTVARVAAAHDRHLILVGRSLWRIVAAAQECGYLNDLPPFLTDDEGAYLPPEKVMFMCTGCQGESRAALARIAHGDHRHVVLEQGDLVIFSSRVIPGNEMAISRVRNRLLWNGVEVIGENEPGVHVSGHPCRDELAEMYRLVRPRIAVPVHGEYQHMLAHAELARSLQVPEAVVIENGQALRLAPGAAEVVGEVQSGRCYVDGDVVVPANDDGVRTRRKLMFSGAAVVILVADDEGALLADPELVLQGLAGEATGEDDDGTSALAVAGGEAVEAALDELPASARRDDGRMTEAARVALRRLIRDRLGKRAVVEARIIRLD